MRRLFGVLFIVLLLLDSCAKTKEYPFRKLSFQTVSQLQNTDFATPNSLIRIHIDSLRLKTKDTNYIDIVCDKYYAEHNPYLWINRSGTGLKSDTLLKWIDGIDTTGIPENKLFVSAIRENLTRLHNLDFDHEHTATKTMAALEYYLTKSYLRYSCGQRFGFTNPAKSLNSLDHVEKDSVNSPYRHLFNLPIEKINKTFLSNAFRCIREDNINAFLADVQPTSNLYKLLVQEYNHNSNYKVRRTLAVNIERSRWRQAFNHKERYILVNIPSQCLIAVNPDVDSTLTMKICYGSRKYKTPLVTSQINYLEVNPYWIIPQSIVKRDIVPHNLNDTNYYNRKRFKIIKRSTGEFISPLNVNAAMMLSGQYLIRQDRGEDNSLGKMIFRFPNPFSIYLHDTNDKSAFNSAYRAVSHGCIRLERPFDLAAFIYTDKDENFLDHIRLTINIPPITEEGMALLRKMEQNENTDRNPHRYFKFDSPVPLYILYYTAFPAYEGGPLQFYPDVYGYDDLLADQLFAV